MEKSVSREFLNPRAICAIFLVGFSSFLFSPRTIAHRQDSSPPTTQESSAQKVQKPDSHAMDEEVVQSNSGATFKVRTDLVVVHVVVRDAQGKAIGNLKKEDFQLFDNHKPQIISNFSLETPASRISGTLPGETGLSGTAPGAIPEKAARFPQKFFALYFDDLHLPISGVAQSVLAATKLLEEMKPSERFGVFTSSGHLEQDFTGDHELLKAGLQRISPQPLRQTWQTVCPPQISYYEAYQIAELEDPQVLAGVVADFAQCPGSSGLSGQVLEREVRAEAQAQLALGEADVRADFRNLQSVILRMSSLPGQRVIAVISPGFFVAPSIQVASEVIDSATRANVVVHAIDTRGVYILEAFDASRQVPPTPEKIQVSSGEEAEKGEVLSELTDGSGGLFFHGRNDIETGLLRATAEPEFSYVLGFSPREFKRDGKYHTLRVTLLGKSHLSMQARKGYFMPREPGDPEKAAQQELELAVTSRDQLPDVPIECQTSVRNDASGTRLTIVAHIDLKGFKFQRSGDRNKDNLRVVAALYDENGLFLTARQTNIGMALRDATLATLSKTGIRVRFQFDVQRGTYLLRVVARESEGPQLGATEREVGVL